jgi:hypothetical protein
MNFKCPNGHIYKTQWCVFHTGHRCPICSNNFKKSIEYINDFLKEEGYKCISDQYVNGKQKLKFICNSNHEFKSTWTNILNGHRCPICSGNKKYTFKEVKEYIEKEGYSLLSNKYINANSKLEVKCIKGHIYKVQWCAFKRGGRCQKCYMLRNRGENHGNWKNYSKKELEQFEIYRNRIIYLSNKNFIRFYYVINPKKYKRGRYEYHLDHIYSVKDGFDNNIPVEIISSPVNLQMIYYKNNHKKSRRSDISKKELYDKYKFWESITFTNF